MDKARFLETFKAIERDYAECVNKELDTDQELAIQKTFKQNLSRLLEILVDAKAPDELANEVKDIQGHLEKWDVYAFWFKEVKNLVRGIKSLMEHLGMYMDANDILPKATPAPVPKPVAPVAPSVQPAMSETKALPARAIPALKPVFKIPPVKAPLTATGPAPSPTSPPFEGAPDISPKPVPVSEPRPLTPVPLGTKLGSSDSKYGPLQGQASGRSQGSRWTRGRTRTRKYSRSKARYSRKRAPAGKSSGRSSIKGPAVRG